MSANTEHRKLAAIMFTGMVGYSALAREILGERSGLLLIRDVWLPR